MARACRGRHWYSVDDAIYLRVAIDMAQEVGRSLFWTKRSRLAKGGAGSVAYRARSGTPGNKHFRDQQIRRQAGAAHVRKSSVPLHRTAT